MLDWLFDLFERCFPTWLYALGLAKLYNFDAGIGIFKCVKCVIRFLTGTSEIERLCRFDPLKNSPSNEISEDDSESEVDDERTSLLQSREQADPMTILSIDRSIFSSTKLLAQKKLLDDNLTSRIELTKGLLEKKFRNQSLSSPEARTLYACLGPIMESRKLEREVTELSLTSYDSTNKQHEEKLLELWDLLVPDESLSSRKTKQWQKIGFQGQDPATDFRGMGLLGLENLLYFSKTHTSIARELLERAADPFSWYSFAIVGINITSFVCELLNTKLLQHQIFQHGADMTVFNEIYCCFFIQFDLFWFSRSPKPTIMDFERLFVTFREETSHRLFKFDPLPLPYQDDSKM